MVTTSIPVVTLGHLWPQWNKKNHIEKILTWRSHLKVGGLLVVEDVALSVVGGGAAGGLVPEGGAALDGQGLVRVDEGLTDGEGHSRWACN